MSELIENNEAPEIEIEEATHAIGFDFVRECA